MKHIAPDSRQPRADTMPSPKLADLPNFGPKSQAMLAAAGLHTLAQLQSLGAAAAYVAVKQAGQNASLNLLWAIEGALTGRHWREIARPDGDDRLRLLLAVEAASASAVITPPTTLPATPAPLAARATASKARQQT